MARVCVCVCVCLPSKLLCLHSLSLLSLTVFQPFHASYHLCQGQARLIQNRLCSVLTHRIINCVLCLHASVEVYSPPLGPSHVRNYTATFRTEVGSPEWTRHDLRVGSAMQRRAIVSFYVEFNWQTANCFWQYWPLKGSPNQKELTYNIYRAIVFYSTLLCCRMKCCTRITGFSAT